MNKTFERKIWEIITGKYLMKSIENQLYLKKRIYCSSWKKEISIGNHMNNYMKLLADLTNVDEVIKDEKNALILLSSHSDE